MMSRPCVTRLVPHLGLLGRGFVQDLYGVLGVNIARATPHCRRSHDVPTNVKSVHICHGMGGKNPWGLLTA